MSGNDKFASLVKALDVEIAKFDQDGRANRGRATRRAARLTGLGWTYSGVMLIDRLKDSETIRMTELAKRVGTTASTITKLTRDLEDKGLVYRVPDEQDGRVSFVGLTEEGRRIAAAIDLGRSEALQQVLADWSQDELEQLIVLFARLTADLRRLP
jgi:DNA-binding MarR family transcriptional regulator